MQTIYQILHYTIPIKVPKYITLNYALSIIMYYCKTNIQFFLILSNEANT